MSTIFKQLSMHFFIFFSLFFNFALPASESCDLPYYNDIEEGHWAYPYLKIVQATTIMKGVIQNHSDKLEHLNRFQLAHIFIGMKTPSNISKPKTVSKK